MCCKCHCECETIEKLKKIIKWLEDQNLFLTDANKQWKSQNLKQEEEVRKYRKLASDFRTTVKTLVNFKEEENAQSSSQ